VFEADLRATLKTLKLNDAAQPSTICDERSHPGSTLARTLARLVDNPNG